MRLLRRDGVGWVIGQILVAWSMMLAGQLDDQTLVIRLLLDVTSAQEVKVLSGEVVIIEVDNTGPAGWELGGEEDGDS